MNEDDQFLQCASDTSGKNAAQSQAKAAEEVHRSDNLVLLIYLLLLIASVSTTWMFNARNRRLRFIHETGLSILYGLLAGFIIHYSISPSSSTFASFNLTIDKNSSCKVYLPPNRLYLHMPTPDQYNSSINGSNGNDTSDVHQMFTYTLQEQVEHSMAALELDDIQAKLTFNSEIFFNILLPPIIFCAGYSMKRRHFFHNFGAITVFAFIGTIISSVIIGLTCYGFTRIISGLNYLAVSECLLFGTMISATDPVTVLAIFNDLSVDVTLHALVFGEAVLNDAVAVVLSQTISTFLEESTSGDGSIGSEIWTIFKGIFLFIGEFGGAVLIGVLIGCLCALLTKLTRVRDHPLFETALVAIMSYCTYLASETLGFTGIVAVLFCGIIQAHYTYNNLSQESKLWTRQFFELLNFLAENFVFVYIGVSVFTFREHLWHPAFIACALLACVCARAFHIYFLSALINLTPSRQGRERISGRIQHMLVFCGLRGAMAFSLAMRDVTTPSGRLFLTTTLVIVIITVILSGGLTIPMLQCMKIKIHLKKGQISSQHAEESHTQANQENFSVIDDGSYEEITSLTDLAHSNPRSKSLIGDLWRKLDRRILKPLFTHSGPRLSEALPHYCLPCANLFTTEEQNLNCSSDTKEDTEHACHYNGDNAASEAVNHSIGEDDVLSKANNQQVQYGRSSSSSGGLAVKIVSLTK